MNSAAESAGSARAAVAQTAHNRRDLSTVWARVIILRGLSSLQTATKDAGCVCCCQSKHRNAPGKYVQSYADSLRFCPVFELVFIAIPSHFPNLTVLSLYGRPRPLPRKELPYIVTLTLCFTHYTLLGPTRSQSVPSSPPVRTLHTVRVCCPLSSLSGSATDGAVPWSPRAAPRPTRIRLWITSIST